MSFPGQAARQSHQSRLHSSGPLTPVKSRTNRLVRVSSPRSSVTCHTPSRNSYTEMVGLARHGGRSRRQKIYLNMTSSVGQGNTVRRDRELHMVAEDQEVHDEGNHGGEKR
jgi:hypothetical protein